MRSRALLPILALTLAVAVPAAAQPADPAAAAALFREGRDAAKRGDYTAACAKLSDSYKLDPAVGTLLNLADCEEHRGRLATAWQLFQQATEKLPAGDTRLANAQKKVTALEPRLPRLTIVLAADAPAGTKVMRDAIELGSGALGTALPVDPGEHVIVVTAPDHEERRTPITVKEGESPRVQATPGPKKAASTPQGGSAQKIEAPPPPPPPSSGGGLRAAGFVIGGVGLVGLGTAIATGLILPGKAKTAMEHCPGNACDPTGYDAARSGKTLVVVNTTTWIVGGVLTAGGAALVVVGYVRGAKPSATVGFAPLPGGALASVRGRF